MPIGEIVPIPTAGAGDAAAAPLQLKSVLQLDLPCHLQGPRQAQPGLQILVLVHPTILQGGN